MKANIEDNIYGKWLNIVPENREELIILKKLWCDSKVKCERLGSCIHAGGITHHGIINSSFTIRLKTLEPETSPEKVT